MTIDQKNYFNPAAQGQRGWTSVHLCAAMSGWAWSKIPRRLRAEKLANDFANAITGTPSGWHIFKCSGVAHFEVTDDRENARFPGKNAAPIARKFESGEILLSLKITDTTTKPAPSDRPQLYINSDGDSRARNHSLKVAQLEVAGGGEFRAQV